MAKKLKFKKQQRAGFDIPINKKVIVIVAIALALIILAGIAIFVVLPALDGNDTATDGIRIIEMPKKRTYFTGEVYSSEGMVVELFLSDGTKTQIPINQCKISGFDSSKPANSQTIRVSYGGYSTTYTVTIKQMPRPEKEPLSVEVVTLPKTEYKLSELNAGINVDGGMLLVTYADGTTDQVEMERNTVFGFMGIREAGTYELRVEYAEAGVKVTTTYTITVIE